MAKLKREVQAGRTTRRISRCCAEGLANRQPPRRLWYRCRVGTWALGPFENDDAADFLQEAAVSPSRSVSSTLRKMAKWPAGKYVDVTDGAPAWAACELVALAFGRGEVGAVSDQVGELVGRMKPTEEQRLLALEVLQRITDPETSELCGLWHESSDGAAFDGAIADLRTRLDDARSGPRQVPKPKTGDIIGLPASVRGASLLVVQVVGRGEIAVFEKTCRDDAEALHAVKNRPARRVPAAVNTVFTRGRLVGNAPVRKDLKATKRYAGEVGLVHEYCVTTASGGGFELVSYDEARRLDRHRIHSEEDLRSIARGEFAVEHVRSPDEREAQLRAERGAAWATRREITSPGPFGDVDRLAWLLTWIEDTGIDNVVRRMHDTATGLQGYGRPKEENERAPYAFACMVALWRGTWSADLWPAALAGRLPPHPDDNLFAKALEAARALAAIVITPDAELRLIWDHAPDGGAALRESVASLQRALA